MQEFCFALANYFVGSYIGMLIIILAIFGFILNVLTKLLRPKIPKRYRYPDPQKACPVGTYCKLEQQQKQKRHVKEVTINGEKVELEFD